MAPDVSVIIPLYNRAGQIRTTLQSVFEQSFQNFEIVVVDDGSQDHPERVLEEVGDPRLRWISQPNQGASAARNTGVANATGRLVAFLDSDDRYLPHHLQTMVDLLAGRSDTAAYSQVVADRGEGRSFTKPSRSILDGENMAEYLVCCGGFVQTSTLVLPREWALKVPYRPDVKFGDDTDIAIRLALAGCGFVMAERPGAVWTDDRSEGRLSSSSAAMKSIFGWVEDLKGQIPDRAYFGYRGWHIAKTLVRSEPVRAWGMYFKALTTGAYSPKLALRVALQILLSGTDYRRIADRFISLKQRKT